MLILKNCPICTQSSISTFIQTKAQMYSSKQVFNFDQCANCFLVFLNPRVSYDELKKYYSKHYLPYRGAKAWGKYQKFVVGSLKRLDNKRVRRVKGIKKLFDSSLILDVGCGKPSFLKACQEFFKCKTMGIDFSDTGWENNSSEFEGLDLQVAQIKDLKNELKPDIITMWHYLEHDYDPLENLIHLKTVSKSSTALVIEIPNFESKSRIKYGKNWAGWHTPRHLSLFSPNNIELLLQKAGWRVKELLPYGTMNPYILFWMSEMELKQINWDESIEKEFIQFMLGMVKFLPWILSEKRTSLGVMTVIAVPN
tara:strand:+ start:22 stop:951 length:930 start_codon:yes stop_codon:yes gene_type:complete